MTTLGTLRRKIASSFPSKISWPTAVFAAASLSLWLSIPSAAAETTPSHFSFDLATSAGAAACLPHAHGAVTLASHGAVQVMHVKVSGLPARSTFTVFVLQLPHAPFGLAWYQGDVVTDDHGEGHAKFIGIFSDETFVVAPGQGSAPVVHGSGTFPDANTNPATPPVHLFHVGMWFDSTAEADAAGCPTTQTPFNGDHTAGIQVLNTAGFPDLDGPIGQFAP
jgi:hypothetical protein